MKGILLLNGQPYTQPISADGAKVYCCDGAYAWTKDKVKIDKNIGDFDSLDYIPYPPPEEIYPSEKDFTDGEIAINKMIDEGIDDICIYGGGGGREDHFLGNLHLLYLAHMRGAIAKMITQNSIIFPATGRIFLGEYNGKTISVLPFGGNVHIMDSRGLKYAYPEKLGYGECRGISNIVESDNAFITVGKGDITLIIINRGKV
jgi:thiamine pyrophosphokinase